MSIIATALGDRRARTAWAPPADRCGRLAGERSRLRDAALIAGGAAWVAVLGQVSIPLGFTPVPLSLGTFAVLTAAGVLGRARAGAAMILFLAAGLAGAPVFAGGQSGVGLATMGYAVGYVFAAGLAGRAAGRAAGPAAGPAAERGPVRSYWRLVGLMAAGHLAIYLLGVPYLVAAANLGWADGIVQGMAPFLPGDLLKTLAAAGTVWLPKTGRRGRARQPQRVRPG
ncbi:MAG: biotin transporter BioY [Bifidobacteriaceae bacterium]|jgi:biotin transport system substrate-specific component|nr:biotin transporter BioY [Bifidobacteriaceae bacterium]